MNMKNFKYLFYSLLALIALFISCAFARTFAFPDASWPLDKGERVIIAPSEILTQTIIANKDGLRRVEILFGKFTLMKEDELLVELRDSSCSSVLSQKRLSDQSFDSEYTHNFVFDRIQNSSNQTYCLTLTFTTNRPVAKDKSPRLFVDDSAEGTPYALKNIGGETKEGPGPLAIRPGYTNDSFFANANEFFDRISQYKPIFLKSWFLIVFSAGGLALTFFTLVLLIRNEEE